MPQRVVLIADPGIDTAFAVALALNDPALDVVGLLATPGNVPAEQATQNVHILIEQLDPPRWPRLGAAPPIIYDSDGTDLHGPGGLGGVTFPCVKKHTPVASDKQLVELVHEFPRQVTVVNLGPLSVLAHALDREPELATLVERIVCLGGAWHEPGNASAVAEFHFACDPAAARQVLKCGAPITLIPLDVTRKVVYSPTDLLELPAPRSRTCQFLRQIVPFGIRATANRYGVEGFHLKDVLGVIALTRPAALTTRHLPVDVETRGELTRGMIVVDARVNAPEKPNVHLGVGVDVSAVHEYIDETLGRAP
ncbi:MAG TPA: nucleoside hydrolase [Gemmataceae bacterium]|jgi:inosine-uridine nucleoside N-ribohydrolase